MFKCFWFTHCQCSLYLIFSERLKMIYFSLFRLGLHVWFSVLPLLTYSKYFSTEQAYDLSQLISTFYFKSYNGLTKIQRIEWNNRWVLIPYCSTFFPLQIAPYIVIIDLCSGISTLHAFFITFMSLYFVFWSDLFSDQQLSGIVTFQSSPLSVFALGVKFYLFVFNK